MDLGLGGLFSSSPGIVERITVASSTSKVSIASSLGSGAFLWPPRVGFSASTGLSAFLAPRVAFSGTGASTFTGLSAFLSFLAADFERDLDLDRLSDLPRPLRRLRVLQLYQQPLLLLIRRRFLRLFR